jgi:hypothetical protein
MATGRLEFFLPVTVSVGGARLDFDTSQPEYDFQVQLSGALPPLTGTWSAQFSYPIYAALGGALPPLAGSWDAVYDVNVWRGLQAGQSDAWQESGSIQLSTADAWHSSARIESGQRAAWRQAGLFERTDEDEWASSLPLRAIQMDEWQPGARLERAAWDEFFSQPLIATLIADAWRQGGYLAQPVVGLNIDLPRFRRADRDGWRTATELFTVLTQRFADGLSIRCLIRDEWHDGLHLRPGKTPWPPHHPVPPPINWKKGRLDFDLSLLFPIRVAYLIMTTASIVRLPDRVPIPCSSVSLAWDWDTWDISVSAAILGRAAYAVAVVADEIEININGYIWRVPVKKITGQRAFGSNSFTLSATSRAAELAAPAALQSTLYNANDRTMAQLANEAITGTAWELAWNASDWLIPAGAWSFTGTPMAALSRLAEAAGAYVQPHRTDQSLVIQPRYALKPWEWEQAQEVIVIPAAVTRQLSFEPIKNAPYDAVYVSGENQGILGRVYRDGTAGSILAEMITDALITHPDGAEARGRAVLAEAGQWTQYVLQLPISPAGGEIPLLDVGQLIDFNDTPWNEQWRGLITGVNVTATWQNALSLRQELTVRRWHG